MKYKYLIIILFIFVVSSLTSFARDGQIDIDELIQRKEYEAQTLEKISSELHQVTGRTKEIVNNKINTIFRNEDDDIVKFDDTSDEINLDYFVNLFNDNKFRRIILESVDNTANFIKNTKEQNTEEKAINIINFPYSVIPGVISMIFAWIFCSLSAVTGKEASHFPIVQKDVFDGLKEIDKKMEKLEEEKIVIPVHAKKAKKEIIRTNTTIDNSLESSYEYDEEIWRQIAQQAVINLENYARDKEFKNIYSYYRMKPILSGRALEDSLAESDAAERNMLDIPSETNLLQIMIKSKNVNKYAGNEINNVNCFLIETDLAYLSAFSELEAQTQDSDKEFWAPNAWY